DAAAKLDLTKVVESGSAPKISIAAPAAGPVSSDRLELEAQISDQGGGVGKVEWRVNGVTLAVDQRGAPGTSKQTLPLGPGDNRIEVVAYNARGLISSTPAVINVVHEAAPAPAASARLFVLAVGVNDYRDSRLRLVFAVPDAQGLADG